MIICAAVKTSDGQVWAMWRPARHHDVLRLIFTCTHKSVIGEEQGFLACDTCPGLCGEKCVPHGLFMRRPAALQHALACGQVKETISSTLTSEDLW